MKIMIAVGLASLACGAAIAGERTNVIRASCPPIINGQQPSGCQIPGSTYYYQEPGGRAIEIRNNRSAAEFRRVWRYEAVNSPGGTDTSK